MLKLLKPYRSLIAVIMVFSVLTNSASLLLPKLIGEAISSFSQQVPISSQLLVQFFLAVLVVAIAAVSQSVVEVFTSERVARDLRQRLAERLSHQSYGFVLERDPSRLLTHLTSDVDAIKFFVSQVIAGIVSSLVVLCGASIFLLSLNWRLGLAVLLILPVIGVIFSVVLVRVRVLFKQGREVIDRLNAVIGENIAGAALVRVLNFAEVEKQRFEEINSKARDLGLTILRNFAAMIPAVTFLSSLGTLIILVFGGHLVLNEEMDLGTLAAFNSYLALLIFPVLVLGFMGNLVAQAQASYGRVVKLLEAPDPPSVEIVNAALTGAVVVDRVSLDFGEKSVLKEVSFRLEPGTRTAVVGPTAAGKSQLINLLSGLLEPTSGQILFDGEYEPGQLGHQVSAVFQESILFQGSLRDNVSFYPETTDSGFRKAVETAELKDFVDSLPRGLETHVSERGATLSGGQKQRVMLARALAKEPDVLFLDDFTARLDSDTEERILANLRTNYPDLTLLTVTQRIASVVDYEQIILLMQGEVLAVGTHQELLEISSEYRQIHGSQESVHA